MRGRLRWYAEGGGSGFTTQFTSFTSTNVQILALTRWYAEDGGPRTQFTRFTSTKVQILTLYQYKSTNTDADTPGRAYCGGAAAAFSRRGLRLSGVE